MRINLIANGVVMNCVAVESVTLAQVLFPEYLCIEYDHAGPGWRYVDNKFLPPPELLAPVPESVNPRQIRQALTRANLRERIEAAVAGADQDTQDWYAHATEFLRHSPVVLAVAASLGVTDAELDNLWRMAGAL